MENPQFALFGFWLFSSFVVCFTRSQYYTLVILASLLCTLTFHLQMPMVEKCLTSEKATERRAGYLAMAVVVEGCADYVMNK